jgi:hypothetical protein
VKSLIFVSVLTVAITLSLIIPTRAFANTPGEPGYMGPLIFPPASNKCEQAPFSLPAIEVCKTAGDGSSVVASKLQGTKLPGNIEMIIPDDIRKGMTDLQVGFFIGYKVGFEAGINANDKPGPANAGLGKDYETGHERGVDEGYTAGVAILPSFDSDAKAIATQECTQQCR